MKLFQQLLLAPAALGLLAPVAAQAADMNLSGINKYAGSEEQVTSISQFSDVKPTDWAYQALSNLIERYGCVAGYPNGTYKGGQAMTRYEAAALLNACLDRISEVTDELKRLMKEFEKELAVLRGRVDGLEAKVGELEATQFSTTTKLKGHATFVIGGNSFSGTNNPFLANTFVPGTPGLGGLAAAPGTIAAALGGGTTLAPVGLAFTPTPLPTGILPVPTALQISGVPAFLPVNAGNLNQVVNSSFALLNPGLGIAGGTNLNPVPPVFAAGTIANGIPIGAIGTVAPVPGASTSNLTAGAKGLTDAVRTGGSTFVPGLLGSLGSIFALSFPGAGSTSFNYDVRLGFDTSFTGKDLLKTTLRASNLAQSGFGYQIGMGGFSATALNNLEVNPGLLCNTGANSCGDTVSINRLYYQFPIGANLTATVGAKVRQDDMLAIWPSAYPADTVLD
ncbi:MAG: iron uptake porin, partial [Synechococcaceae cyanobacterium]